MNRTVIWCCADTQDGTRRQKEHVNLYAEQESLQVVKTISEVGKLDYFSIGVIHRRAKYKEYDLLLIEGLEVMDFSADVLTKEVRYLNTNRVKVFSLNDGEITVNTLPLC